MDTTNLSPQQTALLMSLMSSQSPSGQMVPGGGGKQGTYAPNGAGTDTANSLSKVMGALAMQKMMANQNLNSQGQTTAAQGQANQMMPQTNQMIQQDPSMQALQQAPSMQSMAMPVQSINPAAFSPDDEDAIAAAGV